MDIVLACGVVALAAAGLAGLAWTRPATTASVLRYVQTGSLSYAATVPAGSVYGSGGLQTGEPVYTNAVSRLALRFSYQLQTAAPVAVSGTERLGATIANGQGITRTVFVGPVSSFSGDHFSTTAMLDLSTLRTIASSFSRAAGGLSESDYTVTISPSVTVHGRLGPARLSATFGPQIQFSLSPAVLMPDAGPSGAGSGPATGATPATQGTTGSLTPRSAGAVTVPSAQPATVLLNDLKVADVRVVALFVLGFALLFGLFAGRRLFREATSDDEGVRIATRYGATLVEAESLPAGPRTAMVELSSFAGLLQVARRLECPVLHQGGIADTYAVVDSGTIYHYSPPLRLGPEALHSSNWKAEARLDISTNAGEKVPSR